MTRMIEACGLVTWLTLAQSAPTGDTTSGLYDIAMRFGPAIAGIAFFVWWAWTREKAQTARMQQVEDSRCQLLKETIDKNTEALIRVADATRGCPGQKKES